MGAAISAATSTAHEAVAALRSSSNENAKNVADGLEVMMALAQSKLDNFFMSVGDSSVDIAQHLVPISKVLHKKRFVYTELSSTPSVLVPKDDSPNNNGAAQPSSADDGKDVESAGNGENGTQESNKTDAAKKAKSPITTKSPNDHMDDMFKGPFIAKSFMTALKEVGSMALNMLLGNCSGRASEYQSYTVSANAFGGVFRIDYYLYQYNLESTDICKDCKCITAVGMVISAVDVAALDINVVRTIVGMAVNGREEPGKTDAAEEALVEKISKSIKDTIEMKKAAAATEMKKAAVE